MLKGEKKMYQIELREVNKPKKDNEPVIYQLSDETMKERKNKVLKLMKAEDIDTLIVYCDLEHGANFSYLTGFVTRFEESLLVLHQTGQAFLVLGNENTKMVNHSRIEADLLHCPHFSLPDQPMDGERTLQDIFLDAGLKSSSKVGTVGWKMFTSSFEQNEQIFDIPSYIVNAVKEIVTEGVIANRTDLFIHADYGARSQNNENEISFYEFGSSLASDCVLEAIDSIEIGKTEMEIADHLVKYGQPTNVVPIAATGERFENGYVYPRNKQVSIGDKMSITTGFKGGLASRSGYAVNSAEDLPADQKDYLDKAAIPYFKAVVAWLENIKIGMKGSELYSIVNSVLPKEIYKWHLNPGHLTSDDEWMSSPVKKDSNIQLKSGMILQVDIIPSIAGYAGTSCENGIALADEALQAKIREHYPNVWQRFESRRKYIREELNIALPDCVLPMSSGVAYYTPYLLANNKALVKIRS